jgi:hypothetical protein
MEDDKTVSVNLEVAKRNAEDVITEFSITYETIKTASNFASNIPSKIAAVDLIRGNPTKIWVLNYVRIWRTLWES